MAAHFTPQFSTLSPKTVGAMSMQMHAHYSTSKYKNNNSKNNNKTKPIYSNMQNQT